uniref:Retrotransposon gag domain-containing protein n=1 Tax=Tanacetum cinerariifolium TaxID=118510 RepID=A0A6L2N0Y4_TANCI|nr:hypothetical protein [Tanacetum cinerariifolium]
MCTRSNFYPFNSTATIPRRSNRRRIPNIFEPEIRTIKEIISMANRTMGELLQAPTEGYGEAIVILEILAENFEIKTNLLRDVLNDAIKLMLFPYSLEGAASFWYKKEPPNSIITWDDLVNKFLNQFFPPSKTTHLKNEISRFTQRFDETFGEAWDHLRKCLEHNSLNAAVAGNLLNKTTREALKIIKNKSKVRYSRNKSNVTRVNTNSRDNANKTDDRIDKLTDQISNLVEIVNKQVIAPAKAVEKTCVTCGGAHAYYDCIAADSNQPSVCVATGSYNQNQPSTSGTLLSNTVPNPKGEMKVVTTCSGLAYEGPSIPTNSPLEKVNEQNTEEILDKEHINCSGCTAQFQPLVMPILILDPDVSRTQTKPTIPYPSSFADALLLMPKFASIIKSLLVNKDKLFELAKVSLNENCSAMLLKKLLEKLGDPEGIETSLYDEEGDILYLENLLKEDPFQAEPEYSLYVPVKNESSQAFINFSNPLFDDNDNFTSSDDESISDKDVSIEDFKVYSNPLFNDEEINSDESDFVESNHNTLIDSSPKIDYLEEFSGALMPTSIADEERIRREHEEYISLMERLLTINPCPRPMENFHANTIIDFLPTSPIEESVSQREEIDIFTGTDDSLPPSIESDDYDSEWEIHVIEELLVDDSISIPENESYDFDHQDDPSFPRPPPEPPDVEFDFKPNSRKVISAVINNNDELNEDERFDPGGEIDVFENVKDDDYFPFIFVIQIFLPYLIYPGVSPLLLSAGSEDTIFDPGISV